METEENGGSAELSMESAVSAMVEPDPAPPEDSNEGSPAVEAVDDSAPPEEAASVDSEDVEQAEPVEADDAPPAIEPPAFWPEAEKAKFKTLPPETQAFLAKRESERDSFVQRKANEAAQIAQAAQQERANYAGLVGQGQMLLQQLIQGEFGNIDWTALSQQNPAKYVELQEAFKQRQGQLNAVMAENQRLQQMQQAQAQQNIQQVLAAQSDALAKADPIFADPDKGAKERQEIAGWLKQLGAQDMTLNMILDHALVVGLRKGMLYDRAQKAAASKRTQPVPQVQRPGTVPSKSERTAANRDAQIKRLERSGDIRDAVSLLLG